MIDVIIVIIFIINFVILIACGWMLLPVIVFHKDDKGAILNHLPVVMSCIWAAVWVIYAEKIDPIVIVSFFCWLSLVLIQFLPINQKP